ncbi:PLDc_N domain-containing protein [Methanolobus zinderi]|uniref:PLDc_N domain-containing protein n=1 Tax=Methanolobus zinderi TaxID=536044 RepID=A0A7D5J7R2_9EURY|nr:PLDc N-terminal domain-containing protein [Methanolobus zinderi]QLC49190.1 PLDc_N domain-containing protein [Methanolobus zinderi]
MIDSLFIGIPFLMVFLFFGIGIVGTIFWIWMLVDCAMKEPSQGNDKLIWVIIILFTHLLGALLYFFVRRPQRIREYGR